MEKKRKNEILQMKILDPKLVILDETNSGLDIDALKIISKGVNSSRNKKNSFLVITHYQRLLDYIKPDRVHVLSDGKIIKSGNSELAKELEKKRLQTNQLIMANILQIEEKEIDQLNIVNKKDKDFRKKFKSF